MKAVIMAGGKGTRLQSIAKDIPKPMFPILNKPILEYQIESLKNSVITDITLIVGYLGEVIQEYFGNGEKFGVNIDYIVEDTPLGSAGALYYLKGKITDDFLLIFGDLILDIDWKRFMDFHKAHGQRGEYGAMITLFCHPNSHPYDSDVIVVNGDDRVERIEPKNVQRDFYYHNFVNAGLYCISPKLLEGLTAPEKMDLEKKLIAEQLRIGTVYAYHSTEYVKDMGTPDRLNAVSTDIKNGVVRTKNLKHKQRAVFFDRDGTINVLKGFLNNASDFELIPGVVDAIKRLNTSSYLVIVATNQPVIARGECTFGELEEIHKKMETELGKQGAYIDDLFFCPHHPHKGYEGEVPELKFDCYCRKPKTGMLEQAAEKYNIDLSQSWYVGDTTMDIQTGINAGMRTILVKTGEAGQDGKYDVEADYQVETLTEAVEQIMRLL
ncbi:MAG TPA: D,D-heptose 1,7-bisphosphate phosphatase [Lachnospiraceae bacterium]|nr:D,D-heptose 1,7-bisphosphate phosphatase [Lachnospiraceae bacterium]